MRERHHAGGDRGCRSTAGSTRGVRKEGAQVSTQNGSIDNSSERLMRMIERIVVNSSVL
ncbi:hypothetical protein AB0M36_13265 [Actinoplanes sp. NPDC051346]|uniref:hypothetical protein n=1 Tax=Actinoplanes sp. NPDC051346 TaxID=3155048 RepID=UPI003416D1B6